MVFNLFAVYGYKVVSNQVFMPMNEDEMVKKNLWVTQTGQSMPISSMETSHIKHSLNMIAKSILIGKPWRVHFYEALVRELDKRAKQEQSK